MEVWKDVPGCVQWLGADIEYSNLPFAKHAYENVTAMEKWHWEQIWERIKKDGQGW